MASDFQLKDGDRVLFYGDSITEQRLYTTYVEVFTRTRYPALHVDITAVGVGGDCTWGGWLGDAETRVRRDVPPYRPTVLTINLGMNDGGYLPFDPATFQKYQEAYDRLIELMREAAPDARITLIGPSPFDDAGHPDTPYSGYNEVVSRFGAHVRELAAKHGFGFVDFNAPVCRFVEKAVAADPVRAQLIIPDAIHPDPPGHLAMAGELLKAWGGTPTVSLVEIDAAAGTVTRAERAAVSGLTVGSHHVGVVGDRTDSGEAAGSERDHVGSHHEGVVGDRGPAALEWTQHDEALPFPTDELTTLAVEFSGFMEELNRQTLRVTGLTPGRYSLAIDGQEVTDLSADQLAGGVNLAATETPVLLQARKVLDFATKRNEAFWLKWQKLELGFPGIAAADPVIRALAALEREMHRQELEACKTVPHSFELRKLT